MSAEPPKAPPAPVTSSPEAPFRMADGVMDMENPRTLGLKTMEADTTMLYEARVGASFSHHSGLAVFQDHLYCSWSGGKEMEDGAGQVVYYRRTADGRHWSPLQVLARPEGNDRLVAAGFLVVGEMLVAYHTRVPDYPTHNLRHPGTALFAMTSQDGLHWSEPRRMAAGFFIEGPLRLPSGRLVMGGENTGTFDEHKVRMRMLFTDAPDGLSGWSVADIHPELAVPDGLRIFDYTEPCPFLRADGVVVTPFRNYSGTLYASTSRDEGASWSAPIRTNFPDSMARFSTGVLPDGRVWILNNPGPRRMNRQLLTLSLSDDGRVFDRAWLLRSEPTAMRFPGEAKGNGWQYPCARVWKNRLWISYSINKEDVAISNIPLARLT